MIKKVLYKKNYTFGFQNYVYIFRPYMNLNQNNDKCNTRCHLSIDRKGGPGRNFEKILEFKAYNFYL